VQEFENYLEKILLNRPLLKYCGNRSYEDWCKVIESKADYIGVIFAPSKRRVMAQQVQTWIKNKPVPSYKKLVGIFVNASMTEIQSVLELVPLDIIQCHGNEQPEHLSQLKMNTKLTVWKAIHHDEKSLEKMKAFEAIADGFVIDTKSAHAWGGTGITFNWSAVPDYLEEAKKQGVPCYIAGGICVENIRELLHYQPIGVDLASGIELEESKNVNLIQSIEKEVDDYVNNVSR
jgi:phosphoribosylanthranilate isomerase